jgi:formyl-CoA transferase
MIPDGSVRETNGSSPGISVSIVVIGSFNRIGRSFGRMLPRFPRARGCRRAAKHGGVANLLMAGPGHAAHHPRRVARGARRCTGDYRGAARPVSIADRREPAVWNQEYVMTPRPALTPPPARPAGAPLALAGIRVADFSHFIAGPLCSLILADLGAEVIKIEKADGGDDFRRLRPAVTEHDSAPYLWANRGKQSIALDLTQPAARRIAREIIDRSDVVLENFSTGVMAKFGLDYATVAAANPRLIYASVSAYGRDGALADRLGFDPITQAESGFMSMNGEPDRVGLRAGPSIMDMSTAMMTCNAVLAALFARERLGVGQFIESALFDTAVTMVGFHALNYLVSGEEPTRFGNNSRDTVPTAALETADGPIFVACANDRTWQRLATRVLDRPDLAEHPDYARTPERTRNRDALLAIVREILLTRPRDYWLRRMREAAVPAGAINSIAEAFGSAEMRARGIVHAIPHPVAGPVPNIRLPFRMHGTPLADPVAAPGFSANAVEVLRDVLGYDAASIEAALGSGAVVAPAVVRRS